MMDINDLTKKMISYYVSTIISTRGKMQPVDILEFFEIKGEGVNVTYKTRSTIGTNTIIVKKGLFYIKEDAWLFKNLEYTATEEQFLKEKEVEANESN